MFPDVSSDVHAHKGTFGDTGRHAQALPEARHLHTAGLCSELRPRFSAPLSRLSSSQALSCPTPASCLALARSLALRPSHHPFVCPLALAQAPGSRMAIAPFSQVPTQPNFTPKSGARPAGLVAACLGHQHGGGGAGGERGAAGRSQDPVVAEGRAAPAAMQACLARLPASSSLSGPPSAGLRLLTSEMEPPTCPTNGSVQYVCTSSPG